MVKQLLWLDDSRNPFVSDWLVFSPIIHPFRTVWEEFVDYIELFGVPDAICFDHDLGTETTGYDAVKWLCEYCREKELDFPIYAMQSANPVGRENMKTYIENYKKFSQTN